MLIEQTYSCESCGETVVTGVDLTAGVRGALHGPGYGHPSAPIICRDTVIVGSSISDGATVMEGIPGRVKGFDVRTGEPLWTFNIIPEQGETVRLNLKPPGQAAFQITGMVWWTTRDSPDHHRFCGFGLRLLDDCASYRRLIRQLG